MSGIFGVFNSDDRPAPGTDCTVWADASLYYRDGLCRALGIDLDAATDDADLILAAYLKWGEACVDHLEGDFAFAILDPATNALFCARDHFGMRPFYYHHSGTRFVFASDAREIFAVPDVPYALNEGRIADFIVPELEWIDYTSSFYEGVYRLPPGKKVTVTSDGLQVSEYWEPLPGPDPGPMSDDEWREGFLEVFTRAVEERLRGGPVGVMLSGGMDSGSVAAIANKILGARDEGPLQTVSAARTAHDCLESQRVRATSAFLGTSATLIAPDEPGVADELLTASIEEPFDAEFLFMKAVFFKARELGLHALLDGGAGDIIFSEGTYIPRLMRRGKFVTAVRETAAEAKHWGTRLVPTLASYLATAAGPAVVKNALRPMRQRLGARRFVAKSIICPEFAARVDIEARCERMFSLFPSSWTGDYALERIRKIRPNVSAGRERYARLAALAGVEARDPFLDRRVVDFCAHLPGHLLVRDGWAKVLLREVMTGKLPDAVCWGTGKPHIGWSFNQAFLQRQLVAGELRVERLTETLAPYLDTGKLQQQWLRFASGGDFELVHSAYILSRWLADSATRPVVNNQRFR